MIALSSIFVIAPQLVVFECTFNLTVCNQLGRSKFKTQGNRVYDEAAKWNALITFADGVFPALNLILPLGAMTDFISKEKILLVPTIASLMSHQSIIFHLHYIPCRLPPTQQF